MHEHKYCLILVLLILLAGQGFAKDEIPIVERSELALFPGVTWSIETTSGIMTFEHLRNDYDNELDLPYTQLLFSCACLLLDSKDLFKSRSNLYLGFLNKPLEMVWTDASNFYEFIKAVEFDFKISPNILDPWYSPINVFLGYNYQNYLTGQEINHSSMAYFGYHSLGGGIEGTFYPVSWLRIYGYFGISPIIISGVINLNPYLSYGGSLFFYLGKVRVGLTYDGNNTPNYFSEEDYNGFKMSEIGISLYISLFSKVKPI